MERENNATRVPTALWALLSAEVFLFSPHIAARGTEVKVKKRKLKVRQVRG